MGRGEGAPHLAYYKERALKRVRNMSRNVQGACQGQTLKEAGSQQTGPGRDEGVRCGGQAKRQLQEAPALPSDRPSAGDKPGAASLGWHQLGGQEVGQGSRQVLTSLCPGLPFPKRGCEGGVRQDGREAGRLWGSL